MYFLKKRIVLLNLFCILFHQNIIYFFKGLMEPTCLNIIFIRVCVCNTCGFHWIIPSILLRASRHAPITPVISPSLLNFKEVSLLTRFNENFFTALRIGSSK